MNDTLLDISKRIDPAKAAILAAVDRVAGKQSIPYFVVGAAARDCILSDGHGISSPLATLDVDVGVGVSSWDQYSALIERLLSDEHFKKTGVEHRLESPTPQKTLLDILPFGAIEGTDRTIHWQRDDREMNMAGFSEAYAGALDVKISSDPTVLVKVVSLAGLAMLKLLSWSDNPEQRDRDAKDFGLLMCTYLQTLPLEHVYEVHADIASGNDYDAISARTLGRDMAVVGRTTIAPLIVDILRRESNVNGSLRFILQMQRRSFGSEPNLDRDIELLSAVLKGALDRSGREG